MQQTAIGQFLENRDLAAAEIALVLGIALFFAFRELRILRKLRLEPGQDFAIVGFDDIAEAEHYVPSLTSVHVDTAGLGERAAHAVLKMIQSRTTRAEDNIGAINLVVRESCGPDRNASREKVA